MNDHANKTYATLRHDEHSPQKKATLTSNIGALHGKRAQHQKKPALTKFNGAHLIKWLAAFCALDCVGASEFGATASPSPSLSPEPPSGCTVPIDFVLVLDDSGSVGSSVEAMKSFAKTIVSGFDLGDDASRFAVVTFASDATLRTGLSTELNEISNAIDQLTGSADFEEGAPQRLTSISDSLKLAQQVFEDEATPATAC